MSKLCIFHPLPVVLQVTDNQERENATLQSNRLLRKKEQLEVLAVPTKKEEDSKDPSLKNSPRIQAPPCRISLDMSSLQNHEVPIGSPDLPATFSEDLTADFDPFFFNVTNVSMGDSSPKMEDVSSVLYHIPDFLQNTSLNLMTISALSTTELIAGTSSYEMTVSDVSDVPDVDTPGRDDSIDEGSNSAKV